MSVVDRLCHFVVRSPLRFFVLAVGMMVAMFWWQFPLAQEETRARRAEAVVFARQCLADGRSASACYQACEGTPNRTACRSVALAAMENLRGR